MANVVKKHSISSEPMRCWWTELVTRVGGYIAGRNSLGGLAAKSIIGRYEGELDNEHLYSDDSSHAVR